ncbi:MAG: hypothetical protein ABH846_03275 [Patescibacteria group bacterium]
MPLPEDLIVELNALDDPAIYASLADAAEAEERGEKDPYRHLRRWLELNSKWEPDPAWVIDCISKAVNVSLVRQAQRAIKIRALRDRIKELPRE